MYNRDMTKRQLDYIELKTGSRQKRINRVEWLDAQILKFQEERKEALKAIHRDYLSIEKLKKLRERKASLIESIPQLERSIRDLTGAAAGEALDTLMKAKEELLTIDEEMRLAYYAKEVN